MSWLSDLTGVNVDVGKTSLRDAFDMNKHFEGFKNRLDQVSKNPLKAFDPISKGVSNTVGSNFITGKSDADEQAERQKNYAAEAAASSEKEQQDKIKAAQEQTADAFAKSAPGLKESTFQGVAGQERRRLAGELSGIRGGASSRGLLYSGLRQGQEAGARANSESGLAAQRQGINQTIDEQAQRLKEAPIKTGLNLAQVESDISNQAMSRAIENMQSRQAAMAGLGSALGQAAGTALAKKG